MGEFTEEARGSALEARSHSNTSKSANKRNGPLMRPIPDSWIAAVLLPVIVGCALFAVTTQ